MISKPSINLEHFEEFLRIYPTQESFLLFLNLKVNSQYLASAIGAVRPHDSPAGLENGHAIRPVAHTDDRSTFMARSFILLHFSNEGAFTLGQVNEAGQAADKAAFNFFGHSGSYHRLIPATSFLPQCRATSKYDTLVERAPAIELIIIRSVMAPSLRVFLQQTL